jgi:hypothetical protein
MDDEKIGNNGLRFEDGTDSGFHHVILKDADDGDVIVVNEDDIDSLIERLIKHARTHHLPTKYDAYVQRLQEKIDELKNSYTKDDYPMGR